MKICLINNRLVSADFSRAFEVKKMPWDDKQNLHVLNLLKEIKKQTMKTIGSNILSENFSTDPEMVCSVIECSYDSPCE